MKVFYLFLFLLIAGLIYVMEKNNPDQIQAQEVRPLVEEMGQHTYRITMPIESPEDASVADILWFQKAAELAIKHKIPWFNVQEEQMNQDQVEGVIQLERDPMNAEYDANEILGLQLTEEKSE